MTQPSVTAIDRTMAATPSEMRAPVKTRLKMSRPRSSVPKMCDQDGACS